MNDKLVKIIAIVGPAGAGKSTLVWKLIDKHPDLLEIVVSYTTRKLRTSDHEGEYSRVSHFLFWFLRLIGFFIWHISVHGNSYGTSYASLEKVSRSEKFSVIIVTPTAAEILNRLYPEQVIFVFIIPPEDKATLLRRLTSRGESLEHALNRMEECKGWFAGSLNSSVPYVYIRNDDGQVEAALHTLESYVI